MRSAQQLSNNRSEGRTRRSQWSDTAPHTHKYPLMSMFEAAGLHYCGVEHRDMLFKLHDALAEMAWTMVTNVGSLRFGPICSFYNELEPQGQWSSPPLHSAMRGLFAVGETNICCGPQPADQYDTFKLV